MDMKTKSEDVKSKEVSRRSFLTKGATGVVAGGAAASGLFAAPAVHAQPAPMVLKMQTSWPSSDIWMTFAQQYVDRVEAMSGGRLKIDLLPAGAVQRVTRDSPALPEAEAPKGEEPGEVRPSPTER